MYLGFQIYQLQNTVLGVVYEDISVVVRVGIKDDFTPKTGVEKKIICAKRYQMYRCRTELDLQTFIP